MLARKIKNEGSAVDDDDQDDRGCIRQWATSVPFFFLPLSLLVQLQPTGLKYNYNYLRQLIIRNVSINY